MWCHPLHKPARSAYTPPGTVQLLYPRHVATHRIPKEGFSVSRLFEEESPARAGPKVFGFEKKNRKKIKKKLFFIQIFFSSNTVGSPRGSQPKVGRLEKKVKKYFFIFFPKFFNHIFFHFFYFMKTWKTHFPISCTPEFAPFGTPK